MGLVQVQVQVHVFTSTGYMYDKVQTANGMAESNKYFFFLLFTKYS